MFYASISSQSMLEKSRVRIILRKFILVSELLYACLASHLDLLYAGLALHSDDFMLAWSRIVCEHNLTYGWLYTSLASYYMQA